MTLKIDSRGRIVIPKPIRDRLGLHAGRDIEVIETPDGLLLKSAMDQSAMEKVKGLWVHQGRAPAHFDWNRFVEEQREKQGHRLLGLRSSSSISQC